MDTQLIITHSGSAHFDEMTAISLILAVYKDTEFSVERREPAQAELDNPVIWVVDTGNRHEPENLNFDHHQSLDCPASFMLVSEYLGLKDTLNVLPWWNFKDSVDRIGIVRSSEIYNAGDELVNQNPVESWLVNTFARNTMASLPLLRSFGSGIIEEARRLRIQLEYWEHSKRLEVDGVPVVIGETRESAGLEEFRRWTDNPPDIVVSLDRRSDGWRLFRYEGTPVDFTRIADCPEIEFAHKTGFMAKTGERLSLDDLVTLLRKAIKKS